MKFKFKKVTCLTPDPPPPGAVLPVFGVADLADDGVLAGAFGFATVAGFAGGFFAGVPAALNDMIEHEFPFE